MPTISQRIALEGAEEIRRQLQAMGKAGTTSLEQIEAAGIKSAQGLDRVVTAVKRVEVAFAALGTQAQAFGNSFSRAATSFGAFDSAITRVATKTAILAGALTAAAVAVVKFGVSAAQAGDDLGENAQAIGASVEDYQKLRAVFADAGIAEEQFAQLMGKFASETAEAAKLQQKAIEDSIIKSRDALQAKGFRFPLEELRKSAEGTGRLAEDAAARLAAAGITAAGGLDRLREAAKLLGPEGDRARERLQRLGIAFVGLGDAANRVVSPMSEAANIFAKYGIAVRDAAGNEIPLIDRLRALAVALDKLPDGFQKTADARAAFGRGGTRAVAALADFDQQLKATNALLERFGIVVTKAETETSSKFATSLTILGEAFSRIRTKIGAAFAPLLQLGTEAIAGALVRQFGSIESAVQKMADTIRPIIVDLVLLLNGQDINPEGFVAKLRTQVTALIAILGGAFSLIISGANQVAAALNAIFGTKFTGPALLAAAAVLKFLGAFALVGAAITLATRSIGLLLSGLRLIGLAFAALGTAGGLLRFAPLLLAALNPVTIAAGLAAIVALFVFNRDAIAREWNKLPPELRRTVENVGTTILDAIKKSFGATKGDTLNSFFKRSFEEAFVFDKTVLDKNLKAIADVLSKGVEFSLDWITDKFVKVFEAVKLKADELLEFLKRVFTGSPVRGEAAPGEMGGLAPTAAPTAASPGLSQLDAAAAQTATNVTGLGIAAEATGTAQTSSAQGVQMFDAALQQAAGVLPAIEALPASLQTLATEFQTAAQGLGTVDTEAQQVEQAFDPLSAAAQELAQAFRQAAGGLDSGGGFARGGVVRGAGSSTSDSILGRLSRGEFVIRAAAVQKFGPRFFAALNSLRMPEFNAGGLVLPGFADGGAVELATVSGRGNGSRVVLNIHEGGSQQTFDLLADEDVAEKLSRYAQVKALKSAGRR